MTQESGVNQEAGKQKQKRERNGKREDRRRRRALTMTYEFYYRRNQETSFEIPAIDNQTPPHSDFEFLHYTKKRPFQATTTTTNTNDAPPPPSTHTRTTNLHKRSLKHEQYQELQAFNTSQRSQVPHSSILNANISTFTPKGTSQLANKDKVIYKKEGGMTESHLYENLSENEKNVRIPAAVSNHTLTHKLCVLCVSVRTCRDCDGC